MIWRVELAGRIGDLELEIEFESDATPLVVVGPNGSGKTTILRAIAGAAGALRGHIALEGRVLRDDLLGVDLPPEARRIGYLPQGYALFPNLDVFENVAFGVPGSRRARVTALLERFGLTELAMRSPRSLSGGQRQRVALARAIATEPMALLLDEPMAALDVSTRRAVRERLLQALRGREGGREVACPTIVVTHDPRDARALGGEVLVIEQGRVTQRGSVERLAAEPATDFVRELLSE